MAHYLKSNEGYDHRFRLKRFDPDTQGNAEVIIKGRAWYPKNIVIVEDGDFEELKEFEQFNSLLKKMVIQDLPEIPNNYYDAMELAQKNTQQLAAVKQQVKNKDDIIANKDAEIELLKQKMKEAGVPLE